ncbi:HlyD family efflux transporter periplasmic adaptor subunit [Rudaeicoccus suwonensis]|uniref:HlyD family secretion protein n=1 Tax=Rudaeicoccus suwonensis TaxID=657409 RepID=A0A561ECQ6_9MICO|nr:HlyD family efflux transporter periplasmic adaptor subunit [Rudaeicoccus suwonensis]TWE13395.1 HlyD family secretion protein [Rudaeicoccus suwonensis]
MLSGVRAKALLQSQIPDPTTDRLKIAPKRWWLVLLAIVLFMVGSTVWSVEARLVSTMDVDAAYLTHTPGLYDAWTPAAGSVDVLVQPGQTVSATQPVATVRSGGSTTTVSAGVAGTVADVTVASGGFVSDGTTIAAIRPQGFSRLVVHAFVSVENADQLSVGLPAQVVVAGYDPGLYGRISGRISAIGSAPPSVGQIAEELGSPGLAEQVASLGPLIDIQVTLDQGTGAGALHWIGGSGPGDLHVTDGAAAAVKFILGSYRPIDAFTGARQ